MGCMINIVELENECPSATNATATMTCKDVDPSDAQNITGLH